MFDKLGLKSILKAVSPVIDKHITDEKVCEIFDKYVASFPLEAGEARNIITITRERNNKVYLCVVGLDQEQKITKVKSQEILNVAIKKLLKKALDE